MFNPVRTPMTDGYASEYYPIKPGTDLAVALAMIQMILAGKKYNKSFLQKYSDGAALIDVEKQDALKTTEGMFLAWSTKNKKAEPIDECDDPALSGSFNVNIDGKQIKAKPVLQLLAEATKAYTPEWAAKISEVPAKAIRKIARDFAAAAPVCNDPHLQA